MRHRVLAFAITVFVGVTPRTDASVITGLVKTGGDTALPDPEIVLNGLADGALSYVDRTFTWENVPVGLIGNDYIKTENDDKTPANTGEVYRVSVGGPAWLHVFVDQRLGQVGQGTGKLEWLDDGTAGANFHITTEMILRDESGTDLPNDVWSAMVGAGTYRLGEQEGESMYGIAAGAIPEASAFSIWSLLGAMGLTYYWRRRDV